MNFLSENNALTNQNLIKIEMSDTNALSSNTVITKHENKSLTSDKNQNINKVWTKENFDSHKELGPKKTYLKANLSLDLNSLKTTWASNNKQDDCDTDEDDMDEDECKPETKEAFSPTPSTPEKEAASPSHHARRPMNAFLIFCKKHRPIVRQRFPNLENRGVTRILGEWWALLEINEKSSYTSLAKEYKDAFFSANPDFKWYKLPAPPLRTLSTRPIVVSKIMSPLASPTQITPNSTEFTPGKLADETQLGNLTSLMKTNDTNNVAKSNDDSDINVYDILTNPFTNNNNNNNVESKGELHKQLLKTPDSAIDVADFPPKPIKKRKYEHFDDGNDKKVSRDIFDVKSSDEFSSLDQNENSYLDEQHYIDSCEPENMTQQELMNKVVDSMFPNRNLRLQTKLNKNGWTTSKNKSKETRKSGRSCKGKRYAEFMMEGKLLGNKHVKRFSQYKVDINNKFDSALNNKIENMMHNKTETQTPTLDLGDTIKRLAERTNTKLEDICEESGGTNNTEGDGQRKRTESENSDDSLIKLQSDFNLDSRISELPSLSYEVFTQRKKDSKKRKSVRSKSESSVTKIKAAKLSKSEGGDSLVGSKKRKNKSSITRLEKPVDSDYMNNFNNDLYMLATLAEVAANTEKIN